MQNGFWLYAWPSLNFIIILVLAFRYGRTPFKAFLQKYETKVVSSIDRAEEDTQRAEEEVQRWEQRWREIDGEAEQILARAKTSSQRLQQEFDERSEAEEKHLRNRVKEAIRRDEDRVITALRGEISLMLIASVSSIMDRMVQKEDHARMVQDFVTELGDLS